jgi:hypothetical protein
VQRPAQQAENLRLVDQFDRQVDVEMRVDRHRRDLRDATA